MARPREFDPDTALERATQVFWSKGYEATSLDDLCDAMGLGRSSLYAAFGDKRALYLQTLERYQARSTARIAEALNRPLPFRESFAAFLSRYIDDIVAGPGRRGCFIGNCAAELARDDRESAQCVKRSLQSLEATFREAVARAKHRGDLSPATDVDALARFITAGMQGLRLVGKANPDRATLDDIAAVMLRCLGP